MKVMATIMMQSLAILMDKSALAKKRDNHTTILIYSIRIIFINTNKEIKNRINTINKTITITTITKMTKMTLVQMLKLSENSISPHSCQSSSL